MLENVAVRVIFAKKKIQFLVFLIVRNLLNTSKKVLIFYVLALLPVKFGWAPSNFTIRDA